MKVLQEHERKNGYDYYLEERNEYCAMYRQYDSDLDLIHAYEIFKIKIRKETKIKDNVIEGGEVFPGNEEFGKTAYTIGTFTSTRLKEKEPEVYQEKLDNAKAKAKLKFQELTEESILKNNSDE